jgi:hypothetical protein
MLAKRETERFWDSVVGIDLRRLFSTTRFSLHPYGNNEQVKYFDSLIYIKEMFLPFLLSEWIKNYLDTGREGVLSTVPGGADETTKS